jgi:light-regulated signal transduction histidine kinase (bacteriophytochrome)
VAAGEAIDGLVWRMTRSDGGERSILWTAHGVPGDDCFYLAGKDITEGQRMEDELARRAERLERTNAELQDFAYIASHDLAEPLRMITSYLELLQRRYEGQLDDTADEFIGYAVGGAVRMKALIDDLLTYSRVGTHDIKRVDVDLGELLDAVLLGIERAVADAGAVIERAEPLAPLPGDATQMSQLLQNLLLNAVKFHAPGQAPRVHVSCAEEDGGVRLSVADDGIGISAKHHERIFKMFARLHGRDEYEGTGVGLAVCRRITDRHGGRIWLDSSPGGGSVFHVWLPR